MDEIERASELAKARVLELDAAALTIALHRAKTFEELQGYIRDLISDSNTLCKEIRDKVAGHYPDRN